MIEIDLLRKTITSNLEIGCFTISKIAGSGSFFISVGRTSGGCHEGEAMTVSEAELEHWLANFFVEHM